jgi:hypothetical protein
MGLGLGFCCCEQCIIFSDDFQRDQVGDDWTQDAGAWEIATISGSKRLKTANSNAKITCNVRAATYPYAINFTPPSGLPMNRSYRVRFGNDVSIRISRLINYFVTEVYDGETLIKRLASVDFGDYQTWPYDYWFVVDGNQLSFKQAHAWAFPADPASAVTWESFCFGSEIGFQVAFQSETLSAGQYIDFDNFFLTQSYEGCHPKRVCSAWQCGTLPAHAYVDIHFVIDGGKCTGSL